jgi:hypothetical protein
VIDIYRLVLLGIDAATIIANGDSAIALLFGLLAKYTPSFIETSSIFIDRHDYKRGSGGGDGDIDVDGYR